MHGQTQIKLTDIIFKQLLYKEMLHFTHLTVLHHVSCVQKWLIWFYAVLLCLIPWLWSLVDRNM